MKELLAAKELIAAGLVLLGAICYLVIDAWWRRRSRYERWNRQRDAMLDDFYRRRK